MQSAVQQYSGRVLLFLHGRILTFGGWQELCWYIGMYFLLP